MHQIDDTTRLRLRDTVDTLVVTVSSVQNPMFGAELQLVTGLLTNAVRALLDQPNPARVGDVDFAFTDFAAAVDNLTEDEQESFGPLLDTLRSELAMLSTTIVLSPELIARLKALRGKLDARKKAIERQGFREPGSAPDPIPHGPAELHDEAAALQNALEAEGFETPALASLVESTGELRVHHIDELLGEIDVIAG